ncbi:MAG: hypothetical protein AB7E81_03360 [Hyphomicrobiaceae bacterium]
MSHDQVRNLVFARRAIANIELPYVHPGGAPQVLNQRRLVTKLGPDGDDDHCLTFETYVFQIVAGTTGQSATMTE